MFKQKYRVVVLFLAIAATALFLVSSAQAAHPYGNETFKLDAEPMEPRTVKSGDGTSCSNDFVIKNTSDSPAKVQIVLGGLPFASEHVPPKGIKMYNLKKNLSLAKLNGKPVGMDDWAFIINAIKSDTPIQVYCSR